MFFLYNLNQVIAFIYLQNQTPEIVSRELMQSGYFIVQQSMHLKAVNANKTEACSHLMENVYIQTISVNIDLFRCKQTSNESHSFVLQLLFR